MATAQAHNFDNKVKHGACLLIAALFLTACTSIKITKPTTKPDPNSFAVWHAQHKKEVAELKRYLAKQHLADVLPMPQLLRSASDWQPCNARPFAMPPKQQWESVASVLNLLQFMRTTGVIRHQIDVYSGYRNATLNACADGAKNSAHTQSFALDFKMRGTAPPTETLCHFWRTQGKEWNMGFSIYPSGRIHIDTTRYRTWGYDHTHQSAMCSTPES